MSRFHCCATCEHYRAEKTPAGLQTKCSRLGFATHPKYQFNCWSPKANVRKLMEKEGQK
ncbi:MAG: hypothetical protein ACXVOI_11675 [Tumebacillaceae bacterium]